MCLIDIPKADALGWATVASCVPAAVAQVPGVYVDVAATLWVVIALTFCASPELDRRRILLTCVALALGIGTKMNCYVPSAVIYGALLLRIALRTERAAAIRTLSLGTLIILLMAGSTVVRNWINFENPFAPLVHSRRHFRHLVPAGDQRSRCREKCICVRVRFSLHPLGHALWNSQEFCEEPRALHRCAQRNGDFDPVWLWPCDCVRRDPPRVCRCSVEHHSFHAAMCGRTSKATNFDFGVVAGRSPSCAREHHGNGVATDALDRPLLSVPGRVPCDVCGFDQSTIRWRYICKARAHHRAGPHGAHISMASAFHIILSQRRTRSSRGTCGHTSVASRAGSARIFPKHIGANRSSGPGDVAVYGTGFLSIGILWNERFSNRVEHVPSGATYLRQAGILGAKLILIDKSNQAARVSLTGGPNPAWRNVGDMLGPDAFVAQPRSK